MTLIALSLLTIVAFSVYGGDETETKQRLNVLLTSSDGALCGKGSVGDAELPRFFHERCEVIAERYGLTPREAEVFQLLAKGWNTTYIGERLSIGVATVRSHVYHIYSKLGINSQQRLISIVETKEEQGCSLAAVR